VLDRVSRSSPCPTAWLTALRVLPQTTPRSQPPRSNLKFDMYIGPSQTQQTDIGHTSPAAEPLEIYPRCGTDQQDGNDPSFASSLTVLLVDRRSRGEEGQIRARRHVPWPVERPCSLPPGKTIKKYRAGAGLCRRRDRHRPAAHDKRAVRGTDRSITIPQVHVCMR
jgi:hypothetical protein